MEAHDSEKQSSAIKGGKDNAKSERTVRFADYEDIFILPGENGEDDLGLSSIINRATFGRTSLDFDPTTDLDDSDGSSDEWSPYQDAEVIRESFRQCVQQWSSRPYWQLLEGTFDDELGEAKDVQKFITAFACVQVDGDSPRGLERHLCRNHHEARKTLADAATYAVLSHDFTLRQEDNLSDEVWKKLRLIYKEHSKGARCFARKMGKADEAAVQREPIDHEIALEHIQELRESIRNGSLRVKRTSYAEDTTTNTNTSTCRRSKHRSSQKSGTASKRSSRSLEPIIKSNGDPARSTTSVGKHSKNEKDSKIGKNRVAPIRFSSMSMKSIKRQDKLEIIRTGSSSRLDQTSSGSLNRDDDDDVDVEHQNSDLFHDDIDKKGKTKRSSRWRSIKKRISKSVHRDTGNLRAM